MKLEIPKRAQACGGGHPFVDGSEVITILNKEGWTRQDWCKECYEKNKPTGDFLWRSLFEKKAKAHAAPSDLFDRFEQTDGEKERFFLTNVLLRQKQLSLRAKGKTHWIVEQRASHKTFAIPFVDLTADEIHHFSNTLL